MAWNNINLKVSRSGPGKYIFGSKNIMAKIVNTNLVIRVGGGYMGADEFLQTYGPMEMVKLINTEQKKMDDGSKDPLPTQYTRSSFKGPRKSSAMELQLRQKMRSSMMIENVKTTAPFKAYESGEDE